MKLEDIMTDIKTKPTVPLWPHAGAAYDLSRGATYQAAARGEIEVVAALASQLGRLHPHSASGSASDAA